MNLTVGHFRCARPGTLVLGVLLAGLLAGCGSGSEGGAGTQFGTLSVSLTDAPACGFDAVNVTVEKVRVHQSSSVNEHAAGWTTITLDPPQKINLLDLNDPTQPNFALAHLGQAPLEAGHYQQVRLVLLSNSVTNPFANSVVLSSQPGEIPLVTPSAVQSGIKLIHQFTVNPGQRVDLLLDFDACRSIVQTGNGTYKLKPVIKVIPFALNGIQGFVDPALFVNNVNVNHVTVSAQQNGEIVRATMPNATTGQFFLAHLNGGMNYEVVITADNRATTVIAAVPVPTSTSITHVSVQGMPFTLDPSATHALTGTVTLTPATDDPTVFVAVRQTFPPAGPTVTVHVQPASLVEATPPGDSTYALPLPIAAPSLGQYSVVLPIPLTAQGAVAGMYTLRASAEGYATQSSNVDLSGGDVVRDVALVP
jgi:hypothetical protein